MDLANQVAKGILTGVLHIIGLKKTSRALTRGHESAVTDLSIDPTGTFLSSCDNMGNFKVWMISAGYVILQHSLGEGSSASCILASSPLHDVSSLGADVVIFVAGQTADQKGVVCAWELHRDTGLWVGHTVKNELFHCGGEAGAATHLALLPGSRLAVASIDGLIWITDLRQRVKNKSDKDVVLPSQNFSSITALLVVKNRFPDTTKIVVGSETGRISVWSDDNLKINSEEAKFLFASKTNQPNDSPIQGHQGQITNSNSFPKSGSYTQAQSGYPTASSKSTNSTTSSSSRRKKRGMTLRTGHRREELASKNPPMCEYWAHGKRALQGSGISTFATTRWIEPDCKDHLLFSASGDTTVKMWWLGKPDLLATFRGHKAAVTKLTILRLGKATAPQLFSVSNDSTIMCWSINAKQPEKCQCLKVFRGHDSIINDLVIIDIPAEMVQRPSKRLSSVDVNDDSKSPLMEDVGGGHYLMTSSRDGTVRAWKLESDAKRNEKDKGYQVVHRDRNNMTRLLPHETSELDIDSGKESHSRKMSVLSEDGSVLDRDTNIVVATNGGNITYLDLFPTPQLKLNYRSATAYELFGPLLDWATYLYQKIILVWPTVALCLELLKITDENKEEKFQTIDHMEKNIEKKLIRKGVAGLLAKYDLVPEKVGFLIEHALLLLFAFAVIVIMRCKVYTRLGKNRNKVMKTEVYIEEIATFTQTKARELQPAHKRANQLMQGMDLVYLFLWGTVKILTVPILTHVYSTIDCPKLEDGERHLSIDPTVICWQGKHMWLATASCAIAAGYILYVLQFTFVGCNIRVFATSTSFEELRRNSAITASSVHLAFLTPIGLNWSYNQLTEFCVKATLPAVALLQNQHHMIRCSLMTAILFAENAVAWALPAYSDPRASFLYSSLKFFLLYVAMCTLYGGYHADRLEAAPGLLVAIVAGSIVILVTTLLRVALPDKYAPTFHPKQPDNMSNFNNAKKSASNENFGDNVV